jgi:hypothetical protein
MLKEEIISSESKYKKKNEARRQPKLICLLAPTVSLQWTGNKLPTETTEVDTESQMMVPEQRMPHPSDFFLTPSKINLLEKNTYPQNRLNAIIEKS